MIVNENTNYQSFVHKGKWVEFTVESADKDGDVEISMEDGDVRTTHLNQQQIVELISHLQKQLTPTSNKECVKTDEI